jgi:uncharacterized membrane protein
LEEKPKPEANRTDSVDASGMSLARITSFSDGVFAVAITLLVLSIHVPLLKPAVADRELPRELIRLMPIFEAYIVSFFVIGLFWIGHHSVFRHFKRHDGGLLWLNLLFLMFVVFIPFPTGLISEYPNSRVALIFYAVSLAIAGVMICLLLWYGVHNGRLVDGDVNPDFYRRFVFGYMDMAGIFLLSIPISFWNVHVARLFWFLIIPTNLFFDHWFAQWLDGRRRADGEGAVE